MKCMKCGKNEATVHYEETINGVSKELDLCPECAQKENIGLTFDNAFESMNNFWKNPFGSLLGTGFGDMFMSGVPKTALLGEERKCPRCGMREHQLRQTGRVGCPECYSVFADILEPYLQKLHGATRHIGTSPEPTPAADPVAALKAQLQEAIGKEDYERAASLRDEIKRMEGGQK